MIKHLWRLLTAKDNHLVHCLHWLALSNAHLYAFKDNGPGLIWDSITQEMVESNVNECERAMGFPTRTTQVSGISEQQRQFLLGQAMDLNCLIWVVLLVVVEQQCLASSLVGHMDFYELL